MKRLPREEYPNNLIHISDAPKFLYLRGELPKKENKILAVVGSRANTEYGRKVCEYLIDGLKGKNVTIVSGLAIGIDSIAHTSAIRNNLQTIAIPGSGITDKSIYPKRNLDLALKIIETGGGLISEYDETQAIQPFMFPKRNRLMVGMADAVLVIECEERSGTFISAKMAADNKDLMVVPQNVFSKTSKGVSILLKEGAIPVSSPEDIIDVLDLS